MKPENRLEFLGAFVFWTITGFRGKLSAHYSSSSGMTQLRNFLTGLLTIIVAGTVTFFVVSAITNV